MAGGHRKSCAPEATRTAARIERQSAGVISSRASAMDSCAYAARCPQKRIEIVGDVGQLERPGRLLRLSGAAQVNCDRATVGCQAGDYLAPAFTAAAEFVQEQDRHAAAGSILEE